MGIKKKGKMHDVWRDERKGHSEGIRREGVGEDLIKTHYTHKLIVKKMIFLELSSLHPRLPASELAF